MAARKGAPYQLGDWFLVPMPDGRVAPGRVVRNPELHSTLSYVFAPVTPPVTLEAVARLNPADALAAVDVSGLRIGVEWELLGGHDDFDVRDWPMPEFEDHVRPGRTYITVEIRDDRLRAVGTYRIPASEAGRRQPGGVMGSVFLEKWFARKVGLGELEPVGTQPWWPHTNKGAAIPAEDLAFTDTPQASKVVVVLPAGDHSNDIEDHLRDNLPPDIGEVDGNLMNPDGTEILVYAANPTTAATRIRAMLEGTSLPAGSHLRIEIDGNDPVTIPLP